VIECKRRLGLNEFVLSEADHVARLYQQIRPLLRDTFPCVVEADFAGDIRALTPGAFSSAVEKLLASVTFATGTLELDWGVLRLVPLLPSLDFPETRLYSPLHLKTVFGWSEQETAWDGLICEVDDPGDLLVGRTNHPTGLKWRSSAVAFADKRARGIRPLYGAAVQQIPPGEMGIIYIAYPEFARADVADARTQHIIDADWFHSIFVRAPLVLVNRLYPRPLGDGEPDLVENVLGQLADYADISLSSTYPGLVFTPGPRD